MSVKFLFAWYDIWVGFFWDQQKRKLYFLPIPMIGIVIHIPKKPCKHPREFLEDYHDMSILCTKCNCVIEQYGEKINPSSKLI